MNKSNNPLTPSLGLNFQDQYVHSYYRLDPDTDGNSGLYRATVPFRLFGLPQLARLTVPVVTSPDEPNPPGSTTGFGDINLLDIFLFRAGPLELGVGPQVTFPTAQDPRLGTGKWQAGAAATVVSAHSWGLLGALVTYQRSFAGHDGTRDRQSAIQTQPFVIVNLPAAFYLRSTATMNFDLIGSDYFIPIGLGLGKVWKLSNGTKINLFAEPQYTFWHDGLAPQWQVFMGLNFQLPLTVKTEN